jgi:adenylosuccinate synthase
MEILGMDTNRYGNCVVLGLLRGDEGKGKIVDYLAQNYHIVCRFQGGPNAGHTIYVNDKKIVLHQIPSGILSGKTCVIAHGCVVDPVKLLKELFQLQMEFSGNNFKDLLKVAKNCHVIYPAHIATDVARENEGKGNGSTKCGISQCYGDKYLRTGKRLCDLFDMSFSKEQQAKVQTDFGITEEGYKILCNLLIDDSYFFNYENPKSTILFEGAQGVFLDIDNPVYPNVSSSHVNMGGVIAGTGISFHRMRDCNIIGAVKSYMSSVGDGEFLTEIKDEITLQFKGKSYTFTAEDLRSVGNEYGATTGRPRKVGFLDLVMVKSACDSIGVTELCLTRLDTLTQAFSKQGIIPVCVGYAKKDSDIIIPETEISWYDLSNYRPVYKCFEMWKEPSLQHENFVKFINYIGKFTGVNVSLISTGKGKNDIMHTCATLTAPIEKGTVKSFYSSTN